MLHDVLNGLRVDDPVLLLMAVLRLATAAHQDVHAIVSRHDILLLLGTGLSGYSINTQRIL